MIREDAGLVPVGLEEPDVLQANEPAPLAFANKDSMVLRKQSAACADARRISGTAARANVPHTLVHTRCSQQPRDGSRQTLRFDRFDQVVQGADFESSERVVVISRGEHDQGDGAWVRVGAAEVGANPFVACIA